MVIATRHHGDDAPSGENLEYETVFTNLMLAAQPSEERQVGAEIIPGAEPDPKKIMSCAEDVLAQSNDIRAAVLYGYAALRLDGFAGLAEATGYIRSCLEDFWDSVHPQLDAEDDDDPTMRVNSLLGLTDPATMLRAVRLAPLAESPNFGRVCLRDIAMVEGEIAVPEDMENPPTQQMVSAAFQDTPAGTLEAIAGAVRQARDDLAAINAVFDERLPAQGPMLDPLSVLLRKAESVLSPYVAADSAPPEPAGEPDEPPVAAAPVTAPPAAPGVIASRADVEAALDRIVDYYTKNEPSSPIPLLLMRARRLVGADFLTVVQELAPLGLDQAKSHGGTEIPE